MKPSVSILIVHFNGFEVLRNCLDSLSKLSYKNFNVVVVDNGSTDNSLAQISLYKKLKSKLKIVKSTKNLGFAGGNNLGFEAATGEYVLLLNNDTTVLPDLLSVLVEKMEKDQSIGALQPKIKLMDDPTLLDNAGTFLNPLGLTIHWGFGEKDSKEFDKEREIFSAKGACLFTRSSLIKEVGLFDPLFGSYYEESDFCHRVWLRGFRVLYYPKTYIFHKVGFTSKKMDPVKVMLVSTRNRIYSLFKNLSLKNLILVLVPHIIFLEVLGIYYLVKFQWRKFYMIYGAIFWNVIHPNALILGRINTQRLRLASDSTIMKVIMKPLNIKSMFIHFKKVEKNFK